MAEQSTKPFPEALAVAMAGHTFEGEDRKLRPMSLREVARRCYAAGWGDQTGTVMSLLARGEMQPTLQAMEAIAKALQVRPDYFAEWRLEKARDALDWRRHGVKRALRALGE